MHANLRKQGHLSDCRSVKAVGWAEDIGMRPTMEDGHTIIDGFGSSSTQGFFALFDGHGGRTAADFACAKFHEIFAEQLQASSPKSAFTRTYSSIDAKLKENGVMTAGCTAVTCLLQPLSSRKVLTVAHVGDSRAVLSRSGKAIRLTAMSDHRACDPGEVKRISEAGGFVFNNRVSGVLSITRALGDHFLKMADSTVVSHIPEVTETILTSEDKFLVIACDGLWDVMTDQDTVSLVNEALDTLRSGSKGEVSEEDIPEVLARMLVEEALQRNSMDNVSAIVILL
eukprot:GILK01003527.1.p1 GENE.GILK01003527.1~~GILK01003527.1.p1  ORF type:complete len:321 (-),score=20.28 GILK01003527.1:305-1156(-)